MEAKTKSDSFWTESFSRAPNVALQARQAEIRNSNKKEKEKSEKKYKVKRNEGSNLPVYIINK